jgi:predicted MPP superfamily phosphohydrolase
VEKNTLVSAYIPESFHGFTILHLSDLHIECFVDTGEKLSRLLEDLSYDLCVITGDFRLKSNGSYDRCLDLMHRLVQSISCPYGIIGIPGNHDFIEMVPALEQSGIRMLVNEHIRVGDEKGSIVFAGIDDPHFYGTDDMDKALKGIGESDFVILLAHTPELYRKAKKCGVDYYLCGHTHGGQICLPGGIPIIINTHTPMKYTSGPWEYHGMKGYTSRGTGSAGLPARFFCPPEVTVHRLSVYED